MGYREFNHDFYEFIYRKRLVLSQSKTVDIKVQVYREFLREVAMYKVLPDVACFLERVMPKYLSAIKGVR